MVGKQISALYVLPDGPYSKLPDIDLWDAKRDARKYEGPYPVVAHSPCERWGRYWSGGPSVRVRKKLGDDGGCFKAALESVRRYGGVLEHPEASHAFPHFGLPIPKWKGGWTDPDPYGGRSACVAQGHYGHLARKMTWLYGVKIQYPELKWGPTKPMVRLDHGFHSAAERARAVRTGVCQRLSKRQRLLTPEPFRDLLIGMARSRYEYTENQINKESDFMKLEISMLAGDETKQFLVSLTQQIDRLEKLMPKTQVTVSGPAPSALEELPETDDDFGGKPEKAPKKGASFDDEESEEKETPSEEEEDDFGAPKAKAGRPKKKFTVDDANDACRGKLEALTKKGNSPKEAREKVKGALKKHFGTESVSELTEAQWADCVKLMKV